MFLRWLVQSDHQRHKSATTSSISFFGAQYRLLLFTSIYPGNICQEHTASFINTLLHTYKVTHIHTWQLPSATTVFYCSSSEQLHQSNLEFRKLLKGISMVLVEKERIGSHSLPRAPFFLANPRPISIFTSACISTVKASTYWNYSLCEITHIKKKNTERNTSNQEEPLSLSNISLFYLFCEPGFDTYLVFL